MHKSALALVFTIDARDSKFLTRYLKGIWNQKPSSPRYNTTWNPHPVLTYLEQQHPLDTLTLEQLTQKLATLLALISAHRVQTLAAIRLKNIKTYTDHIAIYISEKIKTSKRNRLQPVILLPFWPSKPQLCGASTLQYYIEKTAPCRTNLHSAEYLFLTYKKPFHKATTQSLSRWIKTALNKSGVDTTIFSGHSTRHAATSSAYRAGVNIELIRSRAGWTENSSAFATFYNRPLVPSEDTFAKGVLKGANISV